jgi:predicted deacylase
MNVREIARFDLEDTPPGKMREYWLHIIDNGIGEPVRIPVLVARGCEPGPVLGLTAALHGNELNGIPLIQQLFQALDLRQLRGAIVGVLVMNVPGLLLEQRKFNDGVDLNRIAPGKADGNVSEVYANRLIELLIKSFDYLIDLHTASFGRINSFYVRADMRRGAIARMARLQNPEIIVHNPADSGTLRGAAASLGIPAITTELKDPHVFQFDVVREALAGVWNVVCDLGMLPGRVIHSRNTAILCERSYWLYTDEGGILQVLPRLRQYLREGEPIAELRSIFGKLIKRYSAPEDGVVIGRGIDPIAPTGSRILHLGVDFREISCQIDEASLSAG